MDSNPALISVYPRRVLEVAQLYSEDLRKQASAVTLTEKVVKELTGVKWGDVIGAVNFGRSLAVSIVTGNVDSSQNE